MKKNEDFLTAVDEEQIDEEAIKLQEQVEAAQ